MKFNCGLSRAEKRKIRYDKRVEELLAGASALKQWHDHFAWWPVRIDTNDCRWLEVVERKYEEVDVYDYGGLIDELVTVTSEPEYRAKERK